MRLIRSKKNHKVIKRLLDIIFSVLIIFLFLPIWILIAILIKITSTGPIFFIQDRPGFQGKIFKIYKFRTMKIGSESMIKGKEVLKGDERITNMGIFLRRSKLDEIPQILNIIKGEMSFVGPRPERVESLVNYTDEISKRLNMRPGLTGLSQVSGNIYIPLEERYKLDVYYVKHFNIHLDIKILIRTVGVVLFGEDKYIQKHLLNFVDELSLTTTAEENEVK